MNSKPIGFFDSGVGGISVLKTAFMKMPYENYIYYGDNKNAPYGEKTEERIKELSLAAGEFLFKKNVKAIVMACNTATSAAVLMMRERFSIPVISMEPAVKPALETQGKIIVLATLATVSQARYIGLIERLSARDKVISVGCGGLPELIERGETGGTQVLGCIEKCLSGINRDMRVGAAVLGCTHYSFIESLIKSRIDKTFNADCRIFDGRHGTVRRLRDVLEIEGLLSGEDKTAGGIEFYSSRGDDTSFYKEMFNKFEA